MGVLRTSNPKGKTGATHASAPVAALTTLSSLSPAQKSLMLLLQLGLILGVVYQFDLEGRRQIFPVLCLICVGAAIHAWLPIRYRQTFFAVLSAGTVVFALGVYNGAAVVGIVGTLIAVCYLPIRINLRLLILILIAAALCWLRFDSLSPVWVVVGSMFMFRLADYLFYLRWEPAAPPLATTVSYFFMLPNICFPFFPVVDFRQFRQNHYNDDDWVIYQRGIGWILWGLVHLLLYRFVKTYLVPEPFEIRNVQTVAIYLATNYALYLEVSGQFHLIVGLLHLFGFNLPRTHDNYFLASSPSDIWRRINIYWKDFLQRLVFSPSMYAFKRWGIGSRGAVAGGVMVTFLCTWLLHSWQCYWLLGAFPLKVSDATLWLVVGIIVALSSLLEYRRLKQPGPRKERAVFLEDLSLSLRVVGMFGAVSLFWALWTSPQFLRTTGSLLATSSDPYHGSTTVLVVLVGAVLLGMASLAVRRQLRSHYPVSPRVSFRDRFALQSIALGALLAVGMPGFGKLFDERLSIALGEFRSDIYVQSDPFTELQNYYEELDTVTVQAGPLLTSLSPQHVNPQNAGNEFAAMTRRADPLLELEFIPGWSGILDGQHVSINQFGMRDRKTITIAKPERIKRIAFVGSSVVMGYGVRDEEVFHRVFEDRMNAEWGTPTMAFEVLNFATGRQWALQRLVLIERKVFSFAPDALYYFAHQDEQIGPVNHLTELIIDQHSLPYDFLNDIVNEAGITPDTPPGVVQSRLRGKATPILDGVYRTIVAECRSRQILPVYVYLPVPNAPNAPDLSSVLIPQAKRAGFVVIDLNDWHQGHEPEELKSYATDIHLDNRGHRLVAERLYDAVRIHHEALPTSGPHTVESSR